MRLKNWTQLLFYFSILLHLLFYISAIWTGTLNIFFDNVTPGQDFYQVPNGAYSFWHGGDMQGSPIADGTRYADCCGVNANVYNPFFTLLVGTPLQLFSPETSIGIWYLAHLIVTLLTVFIVYKNFKSHPKLYLALSFLLLNSYQYYEIQQPQYHFLFDFFTFLFVLTMSRKNHSATYSGLIYYASLLVKPIGALWIIPLLIYKKYKTVAIGLGLFLLATIPFHFFSFGTYYLNNLSGTTTQTVANYNIMALIHIFPDSYYFFRYVARLIAIFLLLYQVLFKPSLWKIITLWTCFQVAFYSVAFPYHYTILAYLIPLGILFNEIDFNPVQSISLIFLTIPTPIIFFHLAGAPEIIPPKVYTFAAVWSATFVIVFALSLIISDIKKSTFVESYHSYRNQLKLLLLNFR